MFIITNEKYQTGFEIQNYKGRIQLVSGKQGRDKVFLKFGEIEVAKDKTQRLPVSVEIGDSKEAAVRTLQAAIQFILAGKVESGPVDDADGVPF